MGRLEEAEPRAPDWDSDSGEEEDGHDFEGHAHLACGEDDEDGDWLDLIEDDLYAEDGFAEL